MSSLIIRVRTKLFQKTAKGVMDYIRGHLQILLEGGGFLQLPNYVDQQGRVVPILLHPSLWEAAGLKVGSQILNSALVENLCKGMNSHGRQLTPTILFKVPVETLLTLPCELSEALREDPEAAQRILLAAAEAYLEWLDLFAVRVRIGKNKKVTARALTLSVCFLHALNRANEAHYHLHILTFGPALDGDANWRTHNIYSCLRHFHHPDGVRDSVTLAVVAAAAKEGYQVLITLGKVSNGVGIGATVNCPDGRVIHARSVARFRSAQILCNRELKCELGVPPLTERELELVSEYVSKGLWNIPEKKCNAKLREKLVVLGLLGPKQGQQPNLNLALKRMDQAMAVIQASLQELPFLEGNQASQLVSDRRGFLQDLFPGIQLDSRDAKLVWTRRYDNALGLVANSPNGLSLVGLPKETQSTIFILHRAGVLNRSCLRGQMIFCMNSIGEERHRRGVQQQQALEAAVPELIDLVSRDSASPAITRGRLLLAGVRVHGDALEFIKLGRVIVAGNLRRKIAIEPATPITLDPTWWKRSLNRLSELNPILAKCIFSPEELPSDVRTSLHKMDGPSSPLHRAKKRKPASVSTDAPPSMTPSKTPYNPAMAPTPRRTHQPPTQIQKSAQNVIPTPNNVEKKKNGRSR